MRKLVTTLLISFTYFSYSQSVNFDLPDSLLGWNTDGTITLNLSNVGLSNWAGGGQDALSISSDLSYQFLYVKDKIVWDSQLDIIYGISRIEGFGGFRKTDDQFTLRSLYGRRLTKRTYLTFLSEFWTQISNGFEYDDDSGGQKRLVSRALAPGYLSSNLGFTIKKQNHYSVTASPFTGKLTMVLSDSLSDAGAFGVVPGDRLRFEGGASINGNYRTEIMKNVAFKLSVDFFSSYSDFTTVDVNLRSSINMKVNELISTRFSITLIYDEDVDIQRDDGSVGPAIQFRNTLNIGFYLNI